jgi:hypothetical protein
MVLKEEYLHGRGGVSVGVWKNIDAIVAAFSFTLLFFYLLLYMMHEGTTKNKKAIVDHLFPSLKVDENMSMIKGERDLAQADKVRKGKELAMQM